MNISRADFERYCMPTYTPWPFLPSHAKGVYLWDTTGKEYIDLTGGIAVNSLGHANDTLIATLTQQAQALWHTSNYATTIPAIRLAKRLCEHTFADKVFFTNSGLEANEAALKLSRLYAHNTYGSHKSTIVAFTNSFHGRSLFTVTAGGTEAYKKDFGPLPGGFYHLRIDATDADLENAIHERCCAVILEPIFGESGVLPVARERIAHIRKLCTQHKVLLIFDEVQTGAGRTGSLYYYQQLGIVPDLLTSAKGLGGGLPIGALLTTDNIATHFVPGTHGSTFGGNPITTAVADTVVEMLLDKKVMDNIHARHAQIKQSYVAINKRYQLFDAMRGVGLLIGWQLTPQWQPHGARLFAATQKQGVLCIPAAGGKVIRFGPSLLITEQETAIAMERLQKACAYFCRTQNI